ncbi:hypothetical protein DPMN_085499 [Dreissena polymorpha]|uniref:Uncharacterized protein n=1 Tax=Dreissena polymorpha TaxID=45954 RepID=A0A9D4BCX8_DREPO|nr:hypothetical protein DPMN_085499 [Dreissena polymorpha]
MILKSDNERHGYGPDKLAHPPAARIRQSNKQFYPSENRVKDLLWNKPKFQIIRSYLAMCEALCTIFCKGIAATLDSPFPSAPRSYTCKVPFSVRPYRMLRVLSTCICTRGSTKHGGGSTRSDKHLKI